MSGVNLAAGLAYRAAGPPNGPVLLALHGCPESSYMWRGMLPALGDAGWRALAPDLAGYGDSPADPPGTWHQLANAMRTPGDGERLLASYTREGFEQALRGFSTGITDEALDEYWKAFGDETRRAGHLELYRSGDFEKLAPYEGRVAALGLPTMIVWGERDPFSRTRAARRFHAEIPGSELVLLDDAGHFVWEDASEQATAALLDFLGRRTPLEDPRPAQAHPARP